MRISPAISPLANGNNANPGTAPGAVGAWQTISFALANIPPPLPGTFQTLLVAGRYDTSGAVIAYDQALESWSTGPRLVPPYLQVLYDAANSEKNASSVYAPVIFDTTGASCPVLFRFATTLNEPASRFDGTNNLFGVAGGPYFHVRGAGIAFQVQPPAALPPVPPLPGVQPPGADFQSLRFEGCGSGIWIEAGVTVPPNEPTGENFVAVVQSCEFTNVGAITGGGGGSHLFASARESQVAPFENPSVNLSVIDCTFDLAQNLGGGAFGTGIELRAFGGPSAPAPGLFGLSATIVALVQGCTFTGTDQGTVPRRGIFAEGVGNFGVVNLTVQESTISGMSHEGLGFRKRDEGVATLNMQGTTISDCGGGASATGAFEQSGLSVEVVHSASTTGFFGASSFLVANLNAVTCTGNRLHGAYFHTPTVPNAVPPIVLGTDLSLTVNDSTFNANGFANSGLQVREGSGLAVHIEQGRLVGPNSLPLFIPASLIASSDFFGNASHGLHLRAGADTQVSYGATIEGVVANNVLDNNGFPSFPGPNLPSWELLAEVGDANNAAAVFSQVAVTQNTFFDIEPQNPLVRFELSGPLQFGSGHTLSGFFRNLGAPSLQFSTTEVFEGFLSAVSPATTDTNFGRFDDPALYALGNPDQNADDTAIDLFNPLAGAHYVNPSQRNFRLQQQGGTSVFNPAIDRGVLVLPGQQPLDKDGLPRVVDVPGINNGGVADCGAYENQ